MNKTLSVIIPCYNETDIAANMERVTGVLNDNGIPYELILIDDGSKNNCWNEISDYAMSHKNVKAIALSRNFGKESALCAGLDNAEGGCCVCIDADMQLPPEVIPEMYKKWLDEGYEVVEGVKNSRQKEGKMHGLLANGFYKLLEKTAGIDLKNGSDFRLLDRAAVDAWKSMPEKQTFFRGMSSWIGFRRTQVMFDVGERENGSSKWSLKGLIALAVNAITSYSAAPLYLSAMFGFVFMLLCVIMIIQTLYMKICGYAQSGFTTVIILQMIIGGLSMISLGIIGLYLKKIYEEVKGRPRYIIRKVVTENDGV